MRYILICCCMLCCRAHCDAQSGNYLLVILHKKNDSKPLPQAQLDSIMKGHLANIERLAREQKLLAAGPFDGGGGIFILNTTSREEADEWLSTDPGVRSQRWNLELLPYNPRVGGVCPVNEPYQMVTYQFVRFKKNLTKSNARDYPRIFYDHDKFLKDLSGQSTIVTEATFGDLEGGVLIIAGELTRAVIESDPAVQAGLLVPDIKSLWIARGSFCEH